MKDLENETATPRMATPHKENRARDDCSPNASFSIIVSQTPLSIRNESSTSSFPDKSSVQEPLSTMSPTEQQSSYVDSSASTLPALRPSAAVKPLLPTSGTPTSPALHPSAAAKPLAPKSLTPQPSAVANPVSPKRCTSKSPAPQPSAAKKPLSPKPPAPKRRASNSPAPHHAPVAPTKPSATKSQNATKSPKDTAVRNLNKSFETLLSESIVSSPSTSFHNTSGCKRAPPVRDSVLLTTDEVFFKAQKIQDEKQKKEDKEKRKIEQEERKLRKAKEKGSNKKKGASKAKNRNKKSTEYLEETEEEKVVNIEEDSLMEVVEDSSDMESLSEELPEPTAASTSNESEEEFISASNVYFNSRKFVKIIENLKRECYYVITYDGKICYVGKILKIEDDAVTIKFLMRKTNEQYFWSPMDKI